MNQVAIFVPEATPHGRIFHPANEVAKHFTAFASIDHIPENRLRHIRALGFEVAETNGQPIPIRKEPVMNFMLLDVPEGAHAVQLRFETPLENDIGRVISAFGLAVIMVLIWRGYALRSMPSDSRG